MLLGYHFRLTRFVVSEVDLLLVQGMRDLIYCEEINLPHLRCIRYPIITPENATNFLYVPNNRLQRFSYFLSNQMEG